MVNVTQEELYNELVYQIYIKEELYNKLVYQIYIEVGKGHHQYDS